LSVKGHLAGTFWGFIFYCTKPQAEMLATPPAPAAPAFTTIAVFAAELGRQGEKFMLVVPTAGVAATDSRKFSVVAIPVIVAATEAAAVALA
jgi:hypothetical protein